MNSKLAGLAGLVALLVVDLRPVPAEACGVKLTIKTSAPRKGVTRTSRPSHVLVIGSPPRRFTRDLSSAGHAVEVERDASAAKRDNYAVVIVDSAADAEEARAKFARANVIVRTGNNDADVRTVEARVARAPVATAVAARVVARKEDRTPVAAGPTPEGRRVVASREPSAQPAVETTPAPATAVRERPTPPATAVRERPTATATAVRERPTAPTKPREPAPESVAATATKPIETPAPAEQPAKPARAQSKLNVELYFTVGSANVRSYKSRVAKAARWLAANPDAEAIIEGHADPTGSADANMALAQTRAETVRDELVAAGIDSSRLEVISYGDTQLKYSRSDRRNRRVAIVPKP